MRKFFFYTILIFVSLIFCFSFNACYAMPTFEVVPPGGTAYPSVANVKVYKYSNFIVITADVTDVSGVYSSVANIEVPNSSPVQYMNDVYSIDGTMSDDGSHRDGAAGDGTFGLIIDVSNTSVWDPNATYWVDISATDNLLNNSMQESSGTDYNHITSFVISNAAQTQIINFTASPLPITQGSTINLSAALKYTNGPVIAGQTITFTDITNPGSPITIGTATTDSLGVARAYYYITFSATGNITIQAKYNGDAQIETLPSQSQIGPFNVTGCGVLATSGSMLLCVQIPPPSNPTTINTFTLSSSSISVGTAVTLTATLSSAVAGEPITFRDNDSATLINSTPVTTNSSGTATYTYTPSFSGTHTLEAVYQGDNLLGLSPSYKTAQLAISGSCSTSGSEILCVQTPAQSNPTTINTFTLSSSSISVGTAVTLTATLSSAVAGEPITFRDNDSATLINSTPVTTNSSGTATYTYTPSFSGTHTLEAVYQGDNLLGLSPSYKTAQLAISGSCSTSGSEILCVQTPAQSNPTTINTFTLSSSSISVGTAVTLTATLSSAVAGEPITFRDNDSATLINSTPVTTNSSGTATYTYTPSFSGTHTLEAVYQGDNLLGLSPSYKTASLTVSGLCQNSGSEALCIQVPTIATSH